MNNRERMELIERLSKDAKSESSGSGLGVVGAGALAIMKIVTPISIGAVVGTVIGIAGPVMLGIGFGGAGVVLARGYLKREKQRG